MEETPNDSGASRTNAPLATAPIVSDVAGDEPESSGWGETGIRRLSREELRQQISRPAVWGLLLLIVIVISVQIWLLFL